MNKTVRWWSMLKKMYRRIRKLPAEITYTNGVPDWVIDFHNRDRSQDIKPVQRMYTFTSEGITTYHPVQDHPYDRTAR